jgi:hypothetical protein
MCFDADEVINRRNIGMDAGNRSNRAGNRRVSFFLEKQQTLCSRFKMQWVTNGFPALQTCRSPIGQIGPLLTLVLS